MTRFPLILTVLLFAILPSAATAQPAAEAVVREDVRALTEADAPALLALFDENSVIFGLPDHPDRLAGPVSPRIGTHALRQSAFPAMLAGGPSDRMEIVDMLSAGGLVVAKFRQSSPPDFAGGTYTLMVFRVRDGIIGEMYHLARTDTIDPALEARGRAAIDRLVAANNRGDLEGFLGASAPDLRFFRNSTTPHALGDQPPRSGNDPVARRAAFTRMFAQGAPAQVEVTDILTFNDYVVSLDVARLRDGQVLDEISIYRVGADGRFTHDWLIYEQAR